MIFFPSHFFKSARICSLASVKQNWFFREAGPCYVHTCKICSSRIRKAENFFSRSVTQLHVSSNNLLFIGIRQLLLTEPELERQCLLISCLTAFTSNVLKSLLVKKKPKGHTSSSHQHTLNITEILVEAVILFLNWSQHNSPKQLCYKKRSEPNIDAVSLKS